MSSSLFTKPVEPVPPHIPGKVGEERILEAVDIYAEKKYDYDRKRDEEPIFTVEWNPAVKDYDIVEVDPGVNNG